jgi:hypothetical protein
MWIVCLILMVSNPPFPNIHSKRFLSPFPTDFQVVTFIAFPQPNFCTHFYSIQDASLTILQRTQNSLHTTCVQAFSRNILLKWNQRQVNDFPALTNQNSFPFQRGSIFPNTTSCTTLPETPTLSQVFKEMLPVRHLQQLWCLGRRLAETTGPWKQMHSSSTSQPA